MTVGGLIESLKAFNPETNIGLTLECVDEYFEVGEVAEKNEGRVVLLTAEDSSTYDMDFEEYVSIYTGKKTNYYI